MKDTYTGMVVPAVGAPFVQEFSGLADLQAAVGGFIEVLPNASDFAVALVNEDGIAMNLLFNNLASKMFGRPLFGNLVLVGDGAEDFTDLSQDVVAAVKALGSAVVL
jgi:hypothetical protein